MVRVLIYHWPKLHRIQNNTVSLRKIQEINMAIYLKKYPVRADGLTSICLVRGLIYDWTKACQHFHVNVRKS